MTTIPIQERLLLQMLSSSIDLYHDSSIEVSGFKEIVRISELLKAQDSTIDDKTINDIGFLLGNIYKKPANVFAFEACKMNLIRGRSPFDHKLDFIHGISLNVDSFLDVNLVPKIAIKVEVENIQVSI